MNQPKIGVLFCGYRSKDTVKDSLVAWEKVSFPIDVVSISVPFKEYEDMEGCQNDDGSIEIIQSCPWARKVITEPKFISEAEARNLALQELLKNQPDFIWLQDADEIPTVTELENIYKFIQDWPSVSYNLNYKNYFGDYENKTWVDGFCPPRIFRTKLGVKKIHRVFWDNDISYLNEFGNEISYKDLASYSVSREVAHIRHLSWLNQGAKSKINYQNLHFQNSGCSYKWDEEKQEVLIDYDFFKVRNLPAPIIYKD